MGIKEIINRERWELVGGFDTEVKRHNASLDCIEAAYQKEYAEWQEGDERLRRMHEEHLIEYDKRIAELEKRIAELEVLAPQWQPIETAPKDGAEIIGWREDCGAMLIRYTSPIEFLTDAELADLDEASADQSDWFYADFIAGGRLEGSDAPTHWMPLPKHPAES